MASGAGLNRIGAQGGLPFFFGVRPDGTPISQPVTLTTDTSVDSGPLAVEGIGFSKWAFQLQQIGDTDLSGYSVSIYGTICPEAYSAWQAKSMGDPTIAIPDSSWFLLPGPAEQSGTGLSSNPMTATGVVLPYNLSPLVAVRAVVTGTSAAGTLQVYYFAIP